MTWYPPQTQMSVLRVVIHVRRMQSAQILREALCVSVYLDTEMLSLHASVSHFSLSIVLYKYCWIVLGFVYLAAFQVLTLTHSLCFTQM